MGELLEDLRHQCQTYRRSARASLIICALCVGFAVLFVYKWQVQVERNRALQRANTTLTELYQTLPTQIYALNYALNSEQRRAGRFEAVALDRQQQISRCLSDVAGQRYTIGKQEQRIKRRGELIKQLQSDSWTGRVNVKTSNEADQ